MLKTRIELSNGFDELEEVPLGGGRGAGKEGRLRFGGMTGNPLQNKLQFKQNFILNIFSFCKHLNNYKFENLSVNIPVIS